MPRNNTSFRNNSSFGRTSRITNHSTARLSFSHSNSNLNSNYWTPNQPFRSNLALSTGSAPNLGSSFVHYQSGQSNIPRQNQFGQQQTQNSFKRISIEQLNDSKKNKSENFNTNKWQQIVRIEEVQKKEFSTIGVQTESIANSKCLRCEFLEANCCFVKDSTIKEMGHIYDEIINDNKLIKGIINPDKREK